MSALVARIRQWPGKRAATVACLLVAVLALVSGAAFLCRDFPGKGSLLDWLAANQIYRQAEELRRRYKSPEAIEKYREAVRKYPWDARYLTGLAMAQEDMDALSEAEASFRRAVALSPRQVEAWTHLSALLLTRGDVPGASDAAVKALAADKHDPVAVAQMALVWAAQGHMQSAERVFNKSTALGADSPEFWCIAARYHNGLGQVQRAEADLRQALSMSPKNPRYQERLGLTLFQEKRFDEAERCLVRATELNPHSPGNWHNLGFVYFNLRRYDRAAEACRKAVELCPTAGEYWKDLGRCLVWAGKYAEAEQAFKKAIDLLPDNGPLWGLYVEDLRRQEKFKEAQTALRKFIETGHARSYMLWLYLAGILEDGGDEGGARSAYRRVLELSPPAALKLRVQQKLRGAPAGK